MEDIEKKTKISEEEEERIRWRLLSLSGEKRTSDLHRLIPFKTTFLKLQELFINKTPKPNTLSKKKILKT